MISSAEVNKSLSSIKRKTTYWRRGETLSENEMTQCWSGPDYLIELLRQLSHLLIH
jgi:hypothetical protein